MTAFIGCVTRTRCSSLADARTLLHSSVLPKEVRKCHLSVCFKPRTYWLPSFDRTQRGEKPGAVWWHGPVISHGRAGPHSGAGRAEDPSVVCGLSHHPDHTSLWVTANLLQLHPQSNSTDMKLDTERVRDQWLDGSDKKSQTGFDIVRSTCLFNGVVNIKRDHC